MADPISIVGTAVGVISLGLQACGEIISYCRAWHGSEGEIQNILNKAESLNKTLDMTQKIINETRSSEPDIADDLVEKVIATQESIKSLADKLSQYKGNNSSSGIRAQARKAVYPFRKEAFIELEKHLDGIQMNLHTSLLTGIMKRMHSMSEIIALQTKLYQGAQTQMLDKLTNMSARVESSSRKDALPPGLIQSWCDQQSEILSLVQSTHQIMIRPQRPASPANSNSHRPNGICTCQNITLIPIRAQHFGATRSHRPPCPLYSPRPWLKKVTRSYNYSSRALGFVICVMFSARTGAGGFSIAPGLRFQFYQPNDDGEFGGAIIISVLWDYSDMFRRGDPDAADHVILILAKYFSERKLVPWELKLYGPSSLVEQACWCYSFLGFKSLTAFSRLLIYMVENGAPVEATDKNQRSALDVLSERKDFQEEDNGLISYLIDHGGCLTLNEWDHTLRRKLNLRKILLFDEDAVNVPGIGKVILKESATELQDFLTLGKAFANDRIGNSLPLLTLAADWPQGVRMLLAAGADVFNFSTREMDPLYAAATFGCWESAKLLLDAGSKITGAIIKAAAFTSSYRTVELLVSELASRRRRLYDLAKSYVPRDKLKGIMSDNEAVPDSNVGALYRALAAEEIDIDRCLEIEKPDTSIYHDIDLPLDVFKAFHKAGFKDVDSQDTAGETPLMKYVKEKPFPADGNTESCQTNWLISMGANPNRRFQQCSATVWHLLSIGALKCVIGDISWHRYRATSKSRPQEITKEAVQRDIEALNNAIEKIPKDALASAVTDDCVCDCSRGGCTSLLMAQRYLLAFPPEQYHLHGTNWFPILLQYLVDNAGDVQKTSSSLIRSLTFNALGLTHTCCKPTDRDWTFEYIDREEVEEIRTEERQLLEDFRVLVDELISEFGASGILVVEFLQNHWSRRVDDFCSKRDPLDEEYRGQLRRLGVSIGSRDESRINPISAYLAPMITEVPDSNHTP